MTIYIMHMAYMTRTVYKPKNAGCKTRSNTDKKQQQINREQTLGIISNS